MAQRAGPPGTARVACSGTLNGEPWANIFWCNLGGGITATQADFDAWVTAFRGAFVTNLLPRLPPEATLSSVAGTLFQTPPNVLHSVNSTQGVGTLGDVFLHELSACKVLSWRSSVYWRGGKPRTYLAGVGQTETSDGKHLVSGAINSNQGAGLAFHVAVNALSSGTISQTQHGFVSFRSGNADRNPPVFFPIVGCAVHPRLGSQRGRLGPWTP